MATILELSDIISSRTKLIHDELQASGRPQPTFDVIQDPDAITLDGELQQAQKELRDAAQKLSDLVAGPSNLLLEQLFSFHDPAVMRVLYTFKIPQAVPLTGSISFDDLSAKVGIEVSRLRRILRYAYSLRIFQEPEPEHVSHTQLSCELATAQPSIDMLGHMVDEEYPTGLNLAQALSRWPGESGPTNTAYNIAFETDQPWFKWIGTEPHRAVRFAGAMGFLSTRGINAIDLMLQRFDWTANCKTFVDVGGSRGHVAMAILRAFPSIQHGLVQDLPEIVAQMPKDAQPADLEGRLDFAAQSFLEPQPVRDADVYFFRYIFHDYSDAVCVQILDNLVPSMRKGSRLVINDFIVPALGTGCAIDERYTRQMDIHMLEFMASKERTVDDWRELVESGSKGMLKLESARVATLSFVKES
ncbi:hypothetical protein LTS18_010777 [Coniosporium uncinatum]|uniref:Uncharacterized protein n=1 Tax=Coniosporium uncinatum TaxID=93489 RepID=A0ACC3DWT3_9PEZI|nr:hypothetical protein LTS18_010777 [Coniosporium uncinatum]